MINVDLGEGIRPMDASALEGPFYTFVDNKHEHTVVVEYRLKGKVVHRSVDVKLKEGIGIEGILGSFR